MEAGKRGGKGEGEREEREEDQEEGLIFRWRACGELDSDVVQRRGFDSSVLLAAKQTSVANTRRAC